MEQWPLTSRAPLFTVGAPVCAPNSDCSTVGPPMENWGPRYGPPAPPAHETATGLLPAFPLRMLPPPPPPPQPPLAAAMKRLLLLPLLLLLAFSSQSRDPFCFWKLWRWSGPPPP